MRLVTEFYLDGKKSRLAFDLGLTVENALGAGAWAKLDQKQRGEVGKAFEHMVNEVLEEWNPETVEQVRILQSEVRSQSAGMIVMRDLDLIRLTLAARHGSWFIVEHEVVDDALPEFADALEDALHPLTGRGRAYDLSVDEAFKYIDNLIAARGERPELMLLKYRVLVSQQVEEAQARAAEGARAARGAKTPAAQGRQPRELPQSFQDDRGLELLEKITRRWPDFAPGQLALAFDLLYFGNSDSVISSAVKDLDRAVEALKRYAKLVPYDPRPWRDLAYACELLERTGEAEDAYRAAIERDPTYLNHYARLMNLSLAYEDLEKAKSVFAQMLKVAGEADDAFAELYEEEGFDPDYARSLEKVLLDFPRELSASKSGLVLLANLQEEQNRSAEAIKTMQRAVAIEAEAGDYEYLSQLYRQQRRFTEALNAANQAFRLDDKYAPAHFERACSLAQLGRKKEALAALKKIIELDPDLLVDLDDPDLQVIANLPEFKALKEKIIRR